MTQPSPEPAGESRAAPPRRRWLTGVALAGAFIAGGLTLPAVVASAQEAGMPAMMAGHGHGEMHAMAMAHVQHMLDAVGASADQKTKIAALLGAGIQPLAGLHAGMAQTHGELVRLLTAPTVDRDALERLRAGEFAEIDAASKVMVGAVADAAEVLRPDQRTRLAALIQQHHPHS